MKQHQQELENRLNDYRNLNEKAFYWLDMMRKAKQANKTAEYAKLAKAFMTDIQKMQKLIDETPSISNSINLDEWREWRELTDTALKIDCNGNLDN